MSYRHGRLVIDTGDYFALSLWKMLFLQWRHQRNTSLPRFWIWSFTFEFCYLLLFSSLMILQLRDLYDWLNTCVRHVCRPKVFLSTHIVAYFSTFDLLFPRKKHGHGPNVDFVSFEDKATTLLSVAQVSPCILTILSVDLKRFCAELYPGTNLETFMERWATQRR